MVVRFLKYGANYRLSKIIDTQIWIDLDTQIWLNLGFPDLCIKLSK